MFWDRVAGVYDIFVKVVNRKTHIKFVCRTYPQTILREFKGLAHAELVMMLPERFALEVKRSLEGSK